MARSSPTKQDALKSSVVIHFRSSIDDPTACGIPVRIFGSWTDDPRYVRGCPVCELIVRQRQPPRRRSR
jgi:hypothetical protein